MPRLPVNTRLWLFIVHVDYVKGFGGKFGVQTDRQDKCALGWDHQEKLQLHESQKGTFSLPVIKAIMRAVCVPGPVMFCIRYISVQVWCLLYVVPSQRSGSS